MTFRKISVAVLTLVLATASAYAKQKPAKQLTGHPLTPEQSALVDKAIAQEKIVIKNIQERTPLVETYVQNMVSDAKLDQVPTDDQYMLSRVDFGKAFSDTPYGARSDTKRGFFKNSLGSIASITKMLGLGKEGPEYSSVGFMDMMFLDPYSFDKTHYTFTYVRQEFLGSVRTALFDVHPTDGQKKTTGLFFGRIWIEDQGGNVVRFNGTYMSPHSRDESNLYFHFDSWRMNMQPNLWLPVAVYVEEPMGRDKKGTYSLRAQTHFWGYSLKLPTRDSENVNIKVDNAEDKSEDAQDVSPLQATRAWVSQAENNVIDRLEQAGLVAPLNAGGYENKVLDQIVINLMVPNNLAFSDQVRTRILMVNTIETTTVGNTILLSKGLIDSLPNEEAIASVVAMDLAHIALGHHIDTRYAFNDRMLFPDESSFQRINMYHNEHDNLEAAPKALEYLKNSMYKDKMATAGLYYVQLQDRAKELKALNSARLGDSLLKEDGTPWMSGLERMAPKLNWDDLSQTPALPLGSWTKVDPWSDKVYMLNARRYAYLNPRDKMPLEVTPIYYKLQRYDAAHAEMAATPAQPQAQGDNSTSAQPPAQGDNSTPQ